MPAGDVATALTATITANQQQQQPAISNGKTAQFELPQKPMKLNKTE